MGEENPEQAKLGITDDYVEGFRAFRDEQKPLFIGGKLPLTAADL